MYTVTRDMSATAVKNAVKSAFTTKLIAFLAEEYGEDNVAMVRVGTASGAKNVIAVRADVVSEDGGEFDLCMTIDPTAKEWQERISSKTGKVWREGFDFETARAEFEKWTADKEAKEADKAAKNAQKIAADKAAREKAKAEKEAQSAE